MNHSTHMSKNDDIEKIIEKYNDYSLWLRKYRHLFLKSATPIPTIKNLHQNPSQLHRFNSFNNQNKRRSSSIVHCNNQHEQQQQQNSYQTDFSSSDHSRHLSTLPNASVTSSITTSGNNYRNSFFPYKPPISHNSRTGLMTNKNRSKSVHHNRQIYINDTFNPHPQSTQFKRKNSKDRSSTHKFQFNGVESSNKLLEVIEKRKLEMKDNNRRRYKTKRDQRSTHTVMEQIRNQYIYDTNKINDTNRYRKNVSMWNSFQFQRDNLGTADSTVGKLSSPRSSISSAASNTNKIQSSFSKSNPNIGVENRSNLPNISRDVGGKTAKKRVNFLTGNKAENQKLSLNYCQSAHPTSKRQIKSILKTCGSVDSSSSFPVTYNLPSSKIPQVDETSNGDYLDEAYPIIKFSANINETIAPTYTDSMIEIWKT
ncbi:hypothetical protein SNEBB_007039 [Seison nebaliae]|nr:hypothetical protein SNEBB_007039 [Seison nebaliae]